MHNNQEFSIYSYEELDLNILLANVEMDQLMQAELLESQSESH